MSWTRIFFINKREDKLRGSTKASVNWVQKFVMYIVMMPFLKRWKGLYVCGLEDEIQKQLPVSGAEVRKKGMPIKADMENLSNVQVSSIQGLPCH